MGSPGRKDCDYEKEKEIKGTIREFNYIWGPFKETFSTFISYGS